MSQVFRSGSALLLSNHNGKVSETSIDKIQTVFEILRANPKISMQTLEGVLCQIPKVSLLFVPTLRIHNRWFLFSKWDGISFEIFHCDKDTKTESYTPASLLDPSN